LKNEKKPWKGFAAIEKPNEFACNYCKKVDSDWVATETEPLFYTHKICFLGLHTMAWIPQNILGGEENTKRYDQ
jgi:hypothetical protein